MFEPLSDYTKSERLDASNGLVPVLAVGHDAGQCGYFGQPSAVVFRSISIVNVTRSMYHPEQGDGPDSAQAALAPRTAQVIASPLGKTPYPRRSKTEP